MDLRKPASFGAVALACFSCVLAVASASAQTTLAATEPIPASIVDRISAEDFGALPFLYNPKLSPSGERVAAKSFVNGTLRLSIVAIAPGAVSSSMAIPDKSDLLWYRWAGDDRLLLSIGKTDREMGEEIYVTRLFAIDLVNNQGNFIGKKGSGIIGDDVLYVDPDGKSLLLSLQRTIYEYPSVYHVDLATAKLTRIVTPKENVWDWFADNRGTVRIGIGREGKKQWVWYRKDQDAEFEKILKRKRTEDGENGDIDTFYLVFGSDKGYVVANKRTGRFGLYHYDFSTDSIGEPIFEHPKVDLESISLADDGALRAVHYVDDRSRVEWFDTEMKMIQEEIDKAMPGRMNRVVSFSRDKSRMLVWTGSASDPGRYYVFDAADGVMKLLAKPYERVNTKALAPVQSITYNARDGLELPAYLTLPRGREAKNLPLIVMPHGGPFARDEWTYDTWTQFLANRGYAVLQPNFRGSTGYGKAFVEKGEGQMGRAMQDDLDDGVKWLVDQGMVDRKRVCIMGASYGGYAAMWAAVRNPDVYQCAISFAGISDVAAMLRYDRKLFSATRYYKDWREKIQGDKEFDLASVSPLRAVDRVGIPLLIAHGGRDENVPPSQSKKLHDALTKANKPHEFVLYKDEGHGFENPENAIDFLKRIEAFLKKHNPADDQLVSAR
jgi:dipeptidyl aminopeptidase/acylaminoacyl peptidase